MLRMDTACYSSATMATAYLRAMRLHQWVKNLFVVAPLVFAKELFDPPRVLHAGLAFLLFGAVSSSVYILNDIVDVDADRQHPIKRNRPIASGAVSLTGARSLCAFLALGGLVGGFLLSPRFLMAVGAYLLLNLAYSKGLKRIAYVDVLCIATGFELRVLGGAAAAAVAPSPYLCVVTFLLASFLGFGKRTHELAQGKHAQKQRSALRWYNEAALNILLTTTALATLAVYAVYALDPATRASFGTDYLILTLGFAAFGMLRFIHLIRAAADSESPTEAMLRDWPFLANLALWALSVVAVIYLGSA